MGKIFCLMQTKSSLIDNFVITHLISRAAHSKPPLNCISVTGKWKKLFREAFPKTRNNFFDEVVRWVLYLNKHGLYDVSKALALLISV
ncbi:hypothetical protein Plhal304r1_c091g0171501 [Plasmopara halstedii]